MNGLESPAELSREWDAVVVGTGMGGATLGYALAQAGWRVIFCEKGSSSLGAEPALRGEFAERFFVEGGASDTQVLRRAGRCWEEIEDRSAGRRRRFIPFLGMGTGGSSALYGMALERLLPNDFEPRLQHPDAANSSLPERWPIAYGDLEPYYAAAEHLYRVRGEADPLRANLCADYLPAPPLSASGHALTELLRSRGLRPYRLPVACDFAAGCNGCQGCLCDRRCKVDSSLACLEPALQRHGAALLSDCEALRIEADQQRATAVICRWRGEEIRLRSRVLVLAAGALATPALLLRSTSTRWPQGLANASGLVGRNLMRHYVDLYALKVGAVAPSRGNEKEIGCSDFYARPDGKFGSLQSFGPMPPAAILVDELERDLQQAVGGWARAAFVPVKPLLRLAIGRIFSRRVVLATIMEDLPFLENRVELAPAGPTGRSPIVIRYRLDAGETRRVHRFRRLVRRALEPCRPLLIKQAESNQRLAHACGTCRFGHDPASSVLDAHNRAHGVDNLYVVDASFFPSSGGTNPALTIAANALRVADHLLGRQHERTAPGA